MVLETWSAASTLLFADLGMVRDAEESFPGHPRLSHVCAFSDAVELVRRYMYSDVVLIRKP